MSRIGLTFLLFFSEIGLAAQPAPLQRLQAKVPVESVTVSQLAGKYSDPTKEFSPGLFGNDLYLFPDGTYVYDEWADIQPLTIYDRERWQVENGTIVLTSDNDITWYPGVGRRYIAFSRRGHPGEALLIGTTDALNRFEEIAADNPELQLMIFAKARTMTIKGLRSASRIQSKLMHTA